MENQFKGKTALITGGASGIGKETAITFAKEGANVVIADINKDEGIKLQEKIKQKYGNCIFVQTNVTNIEDVKNLIDTTINEFGKLDFAFNNAGIESQFKGFTADYPEDEWLNIINVNLSGVWRCMKYELEVMLKKKSGVIINNASVLGLVGFKTASPYSTSKHGIIGLTKTAAIEYAKKGIRINAICPGFVETPMLEKIGLYENEQAYKSIANLHPMNRLGKPEEIAKAVLWLCREDAAFITGTSFVIDGGYLAK